MDILGKITAILQSNPDEKHIDQYIADVRDSLSSSNKQFLSLNFVFLSSLVLYYLIVHEGWKDVEVGGLRISDAVLFDKLFLIVPAGVFLMVSGIGYLRRLQREIYDYLAISRLEILGKTGVHELRLPSDFILGLDILRFQADFTGKLIGNISGLILGFIFLIIPQVYMLYAAASNIQQYGRCDIISIAVLFLVTLSSISGALIMRLTNQINA